MAFGCAPSQGGIGDECFQLSQFICENCGGSEEGRIRSIIFVKESYVEFVCNNASDPNIWLSLICNNVATAIVPVRGAFDGGSETTSAGYGAKQNLLTGISYSLTYNHAFSPDNIPIYDSLKNRDDMHVFFLTKNYIWDGGGPVSIFPQTPITEDITSVIEHQVVITWSTLSLPHALPKPGSLFDTCTEFNKLIECFDCDANPLPDIDNLISIICEGFVPPPVPCCQQPGNRPAFNATLVDNTVDAYNVVVAVTTSFSCDLDFIFTQNACCTSTTTRYTFTTINAGGITNIAYDSDQNNNNTINNGAGNRGMTITGVVAAPGLYTFSTRITGCCGDTRTFNVTVNVVAIPVVPCCNDVGNRPAFTAVVTDNTVDATNLINNNLLITFTSTFEFTFTQNACCTTSGTNFVFTLINGGTLTNIAFSSIQNNNNIINNGSTVQSMRITGVAPTSGLYNISVRITGCCGDTSVQNLVIDVGTPPAPGTCCTDTTNFMTFYPPVIGGITATQFGLNGCDGIKYTVNLNIWCPDLIVRVRVYDINGGFQFNDWNYDFGNTTLLWDSGFLPPLVVSPIVTPTLVYTDPLSVTYLNNRFVLTESFCDDGGVDPIILNIGYHNHTSLYTQPVGPCINCCNGYDYDNYVTNGIDLVFDNGNICPWNAILKIVHNGTVPLCPDIGSISVSYLWNYKAVMDGAILLGQGGANVADYLNPLIGIGGPINCTTDNGYLIVYYSFFNTGVFTDLCKDTFTSYLITSLPEIQCKRCCCPSLVADVNIANNINTIAVCETTDGYYKIEWSADIDINTCGDLIYVEGYVILFVENELSTVIFTETNVNPYNITGLLYSFGTTIPVADIDHTKIYCLHYGIMTRCANPNNTQPVLFTSQTTCILDFDNVVTNCGINYNCCADIVDVISNITLIPSGLGNLDMCYDGANYNFSLGFFYPPLTCNYSEFQILIRVYDVTLNSFVYINYEIILTGTVNTIISIPDMIFTPGNTYDIIVYTTELVTCSGSLITNYVRNTINDIILQITFNQDVVSLFNGNTC